MRHMLAIVTTLFLLVGLYGCSKDEKVDLSAEEIVDKALIAIQEPITYYGEFEGNDGEYDDWKKFKEWSRSDGKNKVKRRDETNRTIDMYDGQQLFLYDEENHMVAAIKRTYADMAFSSRSLRLRSGFLLEFTKNQCELTVSGSEKVAGRDAYHIISEPQGDKACMGTPEYWIDQEKWMVLKFAQQNHGNQVTLQYTKVDFEADISDDDLAFDFPAGVGVNTIVDEEQSTMEEAKEKLGQFLIVSETDGLQLTDIILYEERKEMPNFTFNYAKNGQPEMSVVIFPSNGEMDFSSFRDDEVIEINDQKRFIMRNPEGIYIIWMEDGLHYTVKTMNEAVNEEALTRYVKSMLEK